ncbi:delta-60 repeat domain-containing protein [uncultured Chryseobacterium sp.]|uniref:delta-60 repeat domain-containing protein n=1 Tax=uncultured Chryseobacterium sp. TaxID=259322 RepID=UPI0025D9BCD7|nr:delta-60 repeat domain-containing protein [uncultured Chryseobacterium sp.]
MKKSLFSLGILLGIQFGFSQSVDTNFGSNGTVTHAQKGTYFQPTVLPDGKMILSGSYESSTSNKAVIMKLNADGSLDQSFANGGVFTMDLQADTDYFEGFSQVLVQNDGKLFFCYASELDNGIDPETLTLNLVRLNANGTADTSFTSPWSDTTTDLDNSIFDLKLLSSGKYLAYGHNYLMRFNSNGSLDTTYGTNGKRTITFEINEVYVSGDNIYINGNAPATPNNRTLYRLLNESAGISGSNNFVTGRVYQNNSTFFIDQNNFTVHELLKLDANLAPAAGFGTNGRVTLSNQIYTGSLLFQPGGSTIICTSTSTNTGAYYTYTRLNYNGSINTAFGQGGTFTVNVPNSAGFRADIENIMNPNGYIYNVFYGTNNSNNVFVKRILLPNEILAVLNSDKASDGKITVLENPVGNTLKLSADLENANIYDGSGKLIMSNLKGREHEVTELSKGLYIITGKSSKGAENKLKFIKK